MPTKDAYKLGYSLGKLWGKPFRQSKVTTDDILDLVSKLYATYYATEEPYPPAVWAAVERLVQAWDKLLD